MRAVMEPRGAAGVPARRRARLAPVVATVGLLYVAFVVARLATFGWDPSAFVVAGDGITDAAEAPPNLGIHRGIDGYDGQAYYRLGRAPLTDELRDHGIGFTRPAYWQARIGYPAVVFLLAAGGREELVPAAMVAVNLAAVLGLTVLAALLARERGASPWWALVPGLWAGFLVGVAEDLTEPLAGALLLAVLLALRRERWALAAAALTAAALTRETSLVLAGAVVAVAVLPPLHRLGDGRPGRHAPPWWVGAAAIGLYAGWRSWVRARWDGVAPEAPGDNILTAPFLGLARYLHQAGSDPSAHLANGVLLGLVLAAVGLLASGLADGRSGLAHERLALAAYLLVLACLPVWDRSQAYLRWCGEPVLLGWLVLLGRRSLRLGALRVVVVVLWIVAAVTTYRYPGVGTWSPAAPEGESCCST